MRKTNAQNDLVGADLNLLRMLRALLDTASITRSGEMLNLSQPAASRTMSRLRDVFKDPLLIRTSKGYVLTPLAESLRATVNEALASVQAVFSQQQFDVLQSRRQFQICTTDYGLAVVLQPFIGGLSAIAPNISLTVSAWNNDTFTQLENGMLDLALYADDEIPPDFHYRNLFVDSYAAIVSQKHPLANKSYQDLQQFLDDVVQYPQVVANFPRGRTHAFDNVLLRLGATAHRIMVATPYFSNAPILVAASEMVMLLPKRIALQFGRYQPIAVIDVPTQQEAFTYRMIWHERAHRDQGAKWLREGILAGLSV